MTRDEATLLFLSTFDQAPSSTPGMSIASRLVQMARFQAIDDRRDLRH
jgi:hypothetical protein